MPICWRGNELTREDLEEQTSLPYAEAIEILDFLNWHRASARKPRERAAAPDWNTVLAFTGRKREYLTQQLGYLVGNDLYDSYIEGRVGPAVLRRLFLTHLEEPNAAREAYASLNSCACDKLSAPALSSKEIRLRTESYELGAESCFCDILTYRMPEESQLQRQTPDSLMLFGFGIAHCRLTKSDAARWSRQCCWKLRLRLDVIAPDSISSPRCLSTSRHAAFGRATRRCTSGVLVSWLALRCTHRTVCCDSITGGGSEIEGRSHLCRKLSLRRAGRFYLGIYSDPGPASAVLPRPLLRPRRLRGIEKFSEHYKLAYLTAELPCSVDHGIIGLMDPAHGPFVHQAWWWRSRH